MGQGQRGSRVCSGYLNNCNSRENKGQRCELGSS